MASASPSQLNSLARRKVFFPVFGALNVTGPSLVDPMASRLLHDLTWRLAALSRTLAALFGLEKATLGVGVIHRHQHTQARRDGVRSEMAS